MPLSASSLSSKMLNNLKETFSPKDDSMLKANCDALAKAIVEEITQNAVVKSSNISVAGGAAGAPPYIGPVNGAIGQLTDGKIS